MTNSRVSIITPTFNSSKYISDTIQSVIDQTYAQWELIIIDDCSNDNTINIVTSFTLLDSRIKLLQNKRNMGAAFSRNAGMRASKYEYIAFLDGDDVWAEDKLQKQLLFMQSNNISFSFTGYLIVNSLGNKTGRKVDTTQRGSFSYKDMLAKKATLGCSTVILNKHPFNHLLEMPALRTGQDYAFWLKLLRNTNKKAHILPLALTSYRITPNSISRNKFKKAKRQWFIYRENENLNLFMSSYYFCHYAFRAIFRTT